MKYTWTTYLRRDDENIWFSGSEVDCRGSREKNFHKNLINKLFTSRSRRQSVEKIFANLFSTNFCHRDFVISLKQLNKLEIIQLEISCLWWDLCRLDDCFDTLHRGLSLIKERIYYKKLITNSFFAFRRQCYFVRYFSAVYPPLVQSRLPKYLPKTSVFGFPFRGNKKDV